MLSVRNDLKVSPIKEKIGLVILYLVVSMICAGGVSVIPQVFIREGNHGTVIREDTYNIPIVSIKNEENTYGSFFLGCGSINATEYYVYFKQYEDGGIKMGKLRVDDCSLYERKEESPRIEWTEVTKRVHWTVRFGFDATDIQTSRVGDFKMIVPEGTILERFEIK